MQFWLKFFHIAAMTVWFSGLFFLPRLFVAGVRGSDPESLHEQKAIGRTLYFAITTPAGAVTIGLGIALMAYGFRGAWLPAKLMLVGLAVLLHVYLGQMLLDLGRGRLRHGPAFYRVLNWSPLLILLAIAALAAAKPGALPPLGGP
jgi:protoporphyrinogen IX oxidase